MKRSLSILLILSALPAAAQVRVAPAQLPGLPVSAIVAPAASVPAGAPSLGLTPSLTPALSASFAPAPSIDPKASAPVPEAFAPAANDALATPERLQSLFRVLDRQFPLPAGSPTLAVRARVRAQLLNAARDYTDPEHDLLETVAREADKALARIQQRLDAGEIDPAARIRVGESDPVLPVTAHPARVGVYPVAADPFQWGHLLVALRAVGDLGVDKIVFVLAGDDPRKPNMTPVVDRHPMGREVLDVFSPFFVYSPIAVGTTLDGETNIMRILALNTEQRIEAWYMVGDDHYRLVDKNGNPDTLPKLARNFKADLGHNEALHELKVAFIKREHPAEAVPTDLEVRFLDHVGFEASSTQVRKGQHTLMPHAAYDYARRANLYGLVTALPLTAGGPMWQELLDKARAASGIAVKKLLSARGAVKVRAVLASKDTKTITEYTGVPGRVEELKPGTRVYRHWVRSEADLDAIIAQGALRAGPVSYAEFTGSQRAFIKDIYVDLHGVFFTTPAHAAAEPRVMNEATPHWIDFRLPKGVRALRLDGDEVLMIPAGTGDYVPVEIVGSSRG